MTLYHVVLPAKYRRTVFDKRVDEVQREACLEIVERYQMKFLKIGADHDHITFVQYGDVQRTRSVTVLKNFTAREILPNVSTREEEAVGRRILH